jgi:signal transduction histidine kinase
MADPLSVKVTVPNGEWILKVVRSEGWHMPMLTFVWLTLAVLVISGLLAAQAYHLLHQPMLLKQEVAARTAELNDANQSLQTEIFQHWQAEMALRESERQLEQRVADRTRELGEANAALKQEQKEQRELIEKLADTRNQLTQSRMMAAVGQLAAGVAHEINNPLGFIISNVSVMEKYVQSMLEALEQQFALMAKGNQDSQAVLEALVNIRGGLDLSGIQEDLPLLLQESLEGLYRVRDVVQHLREFSSVDCKHDQLLDLNQCLKTVLSVMSAEMGERIKLVSEFGELPPVHANAGQMNQVFRHILLNAIQAIETEGEIRVVTRCEAGHVDIVFSDSGCGVKPELLEHIFEPFFSTREVGKGKGLGLAIAYHVVKSHGGELTVASEPGHGAQFTLRLPVAEGSSSPPETR